MGAGFQGFRIIRLSRKLNGLGCLTYLQSSLVCVRSPDQQVKYRSSILSSQADSQPTCPNPLLDTMAPGDAPATPLNYRDADQQHPDSYAPGRPSTNSAANSAA